MDKYKIRQTTELPVASRPISIIGAGGIVKDAHLPAYKKAGFDVVGITDIDRSKADSLAQASGILNVYDTAEQLIAAAPEDVVFDIAVPASVITEVLPKLPNGSVVLIQKPMGETLEQAKEILSTCNEKRLLAAINFQMRYAPYVLAAKSLIDQGAIGQLCDIEVRLTVDTPWHLWSFLEGIPRMEILYHSIHYIDTMRSFLGEPQGVYAKTIGHPRMPKIRQARSSILLDYGDMMRATITANHGHNFGPRNQESYIKWEGTKGAIKATMGLLLDYPHGKPDAFEYCVLEEGQTPEWKQVELEGSWFPDAFIGTMGSLMCFAEGSSSVLPTSVEESYKTMAVVEAAYESSCTGGTTVPV